MKKTYPDLETPLLRESCFIDETEQIADKSQIRGSLESNSSIGDAIQDKSSKRADQDLTSGDRPIPVAHVTLSPAKKAAIHLYNWMEALVPALILVLLIFLFVVKVIGIEGSSMLPTLNNGDYVLVTAGLSRPPRQGDVVVLRKNSFLSDPIVKRVIATESQTVAIDFETGTVRVDGKPLNEPYILEKTQRMYDVSFPVKVPKGCIFVLGDNRNWSTDSRFSGVGMVDNRCILGKVMMILAPPRRIGAIR